jgi:hypothetical protein
MKAIKYFFVCVLYLSLLGCQSCKKDPDPPKPEPTYYTVNAITADGVTLFPSGSMKVEDGKSISFDLNSGSNKRYKILLGGVAVTGYLTGSYSYQIVVTSNLSIQIVSEVVNFTVTATAGIGGSVTPNGVTTVEYGKDLTLTPTPDPEYTLTAIKVNGLSVPVVRPYPLTNVTANSDVKFEFTLTNFLTLSNGADNKSRYWKYTNSDWYDVNHVYEFHLIINPVLLADKWYFYTNGKVETFNAAGVLDGNGLWTMLPGNVFTSGSQTYTVIELTDNKFVYEQKGQFTLGVTEYVRTTLMRQ